MNKYHILYATSEKYFPHMMTSIYSLLENNKDLSFHINIVENDFTYEHKQLLDGLLSLYPNSDLIFYDVIDFDILTDLHRLPKWRGSDISNAKLFASELLENVDKILYLDSDTLVVDSIKPLLNAKLSHPISAVMEPKIPKRMLGTLDTYYNSGVLLFDGEKMDHGDCVSMIYNTLRNNEVELLYPAQDILNVALQSRIGNLDLSYNITPYINDLSKHPILLKKFCAENASFYTEEEIIEAVSHPRILHHSAYLNSRVWDDNRIHPFRKQYKYYRNLWDDDFQKDKNDSILTKIPFLPYLNMAANSFFPESTCKKIKSNVKQKVK